MESELNKKIKEIIDFLLGRYNRHLLKGTKHVGRKETVRQISKLISQSLDQNNKEWLKRDEGLKIKKQIGGSFIREGYNFAVKDINTSIDNLINKYKQL